MRSLRRISICLLLAVACQDDEEAPQLPAPLSVVPGAASVKADGTNTVTFTISGATLGPIQVSATRGTFTDTNDKQTVVQGVSGTVELRTCDARAAGCAGTVHVTAIDANSAVGAASVTFTGFETCTNRVDDNGDGRVDCADPDCATAACVTDGGAVGACVGTTCVCNASAATETSCTDGIDEDCDGAVDCADSDCAAQRCVAPGGGVGTCTAGACVCTPTGAVETACGDGKDDDCDGAVDCGDTDCDGKACQTASGPGTCQANQCIVNQCTPTGPEACSGNLDEDCDGLVDCADPDCDGKICSSAGFVCANEACTDLTSGFSLEIAPERTALPADGAAQMRIAIRVLQNGAPVPGASVAVTADLGTLSAATLVTDDAGEATVTYTAAATAGRATVTAALASPAIEATASISLPALGAIRLAQGSTPGVQYAVMGVKGSGFNEQNQLVVEVLDADQKPYPAGLAVRFEHRALAGSLLSQTPSSDAACPAPCMYYVAQTDAQGLARVNLYSGTKAGTLEVTAFAAAGGDSRKYALPTVAVIGARANAGAFTIVCDPENVPGFQVHDCSHSLVDTQYTCVALLQDRYQNMLGLAMPITFVSETSRIGQVTFTSAYDPGAGGPAQQDLGTALQVFGVLGGYLPEDVPPVAGEPSVAYADECSAPATRIHNPRDGVLTVIAIADGEEAFTDLNGNGVYDDAVDVDGDGVLDGPEPFVDLPEPFVDYNDNGVQDPGEVFEDVNGNGKWDGPNGVWDAYTKIWTQTAIVMTGAPTGPFPTPSGDLIGSRWVASADFVGACTPTPSPPPFSVLSEKEIPDPSDPTKTITIPPTTDTFVVVGSDWNLNVLSAATTYRVALEEPTGIETFFNGKAALPDTKGFFYRYWPCDEMGRCAVRCTPEPGARCEMKPAVVNFACGASGGVTIRGGKEPTGAETATFIQVLGPNELQLPLLGSHL